LQEAEKRQHRILDADYRKIEVYPFVQELAHLTEDEKQVLGKTLQKFPKVPNNIWRWTWNVKYQNCKVIIYMVQSLTMQDHSLYQIRWKQLQNMMLKY
jgi:acyl carrier protein phosphodiesterase